MNEIMVLYARPLPLGPERMHMNPRYPMSLSRWSTFVPKWDVFPG